MSEDNTFISCSPPSWLAGTIGCSHLVIRVSGSLCYQPGLVSGAWSPNTRDRKGSLSCAWKGWWWLMNNCKDNHRLPSGSDGKESACNVGDSDSISGSGRSPGKRMATHSNILAWEIQWTREAWWATLHGSKKVGHNWVNNTQWQPQEDEENIFSLKAKWDQGRGQER